MKHETNSRKESSRTKDYLWLFGLCTARLCFVLIQMTYAATLPVLRKEWGMSASQAGLIQSAFQIGTLISLVVLSTLSDYLGAKRVFLGSSLGASIASLLFAIFAHDFLSGFLLFGAIALFLGGSYTPGLTIIAERFEPRTRGQAMGFFLGASSFGYAVSLSLSGLIIAYSGWRSAFYVTGLGPALGTILAFWILKETPNIIPTKAADSKREGFWKAVMANKAAMLVILGYVAHSWEILGMWAWTPAFLAASIAIKGTEAGRSAGLGANLSALFHLMGFTANIIAGGLSDRWGRTAVIGMMGTISLLCSFTFGWLISSPLWLVMIIGLVYGFTAIADSPIYSTAITEVVNPRYLGAALALRSLLGFGAGAISPFVFGAVLDWTNPFSGSDPTHYWGWAFTSLGIGAFFGPLMILWLRHLPESRQMAGGKR
ncbi:MAG: MFS transporter [Candidatus Tectomicrobia bacterium]|nr:MFS transporter [Candidatus Tectomicrobia bacterium]